jgi:hypothetical protein
VKSLRKNVVLLVLLVGTSVVAQPSPSPDTPPDTTGDGAGTDGAGTDAGAAISGQVTVKLSSAEMTAQITTLDAQTEDDARHVVRLQIQARKEKDVIKLNCINDKLLQIKALRNIIEGAKTDFEISTSSNNADEQHYQFTRITLSAENIRALREEANACAGEIPDVIGETKVGWDGPDLPDDPTDPFGTDIEVPVYASPYN